MRILIVTDYPVKKGSPEEQAFKNKFPIITAGATEIGVIYVQDWLKDRRTFEGTAFDLIMLPSSIQEIDEVYEPAYRLAFDLTASARGTVSYF